MIKQIVFSALMASSLGVAAATPMMTAFSDYLSSVSPSNEWLTEAKRAYNSEQSAAHLVDVLRGKSSALTRDEYLLVELLVKSSEMKNMGINPSIIAAQFRGANLQTTEGKSMVLERIDSSALENQQMSDSQRQNNKITYTNQWIDGFNEFMGRSSSIIRQSIYLDKVSYTDINTTKAISLMSDNRLFNSNGVYLSSDASKPIVTISDGKLNGLFGSIMVRDYYLTRHNANGYAYVVRNVPHEWCSRMLTELPSTIVEVRVDGQLLMDGVQPERLCNTKSDLLLATR